MNCCSAPEYHPGKLKADKTNCLRGGLEMLFSDQRHHKLSIPARDSHGGPVTIAHLIDHLCQHVMNDSRKELFVLDNHMYVQLRPQPRKREEMRNKRPPRDSTSLIPISSHFAIPTPHTSERLRPYNHC